MALDLASVRSGIAANLAALDGLRVVDHLPDEVSPPAAVVGLPDDHEFDQAFGRGHDKVTIPVVLLAGATSARAAQVKLDGWASGTATGTVKAAVEADRTLGGVADDCRVVRAHDYGRYTVAGTELLGVTFDVEVIG